MSLATEDRKNKAAAWGKKTANKNFKHNSKKVISNWYDCKGMKAYICEEYDRLFIDTPTQAIAVDTIAQAEDWLMRNDYKKK